MSRRSTLLQMLLDEESLSDGDEEFISLAVDIVHDEFDDDEVPKRGGSVIGHAVINRERLAGHRRLYNDYFSEEPTYLDVQFRHRFRMRRPLFLRIMNAIEAHDEYFVQKRNVAGVLGLSCLQKVTAVSRMLCYGIAADAVDEYVRIGGSTVIESFNRFVVAIDEVFGEEYLRTPNENDIARLLAQGEERGFPGMLGSLDCMHWQWKNCPTAWQGQYKGKEGVPTIVLEAVASRDRWFWHAFFGSPGSHNDINVLQRSPLFAKLAEGQAPKVNYSINGHDYTMGYYLADGIYPSWATLVKSIKLPQGNKRKYFSKAQEAARKDVEQAFGVLQARFAIVRGPARFWKALTLNQIMRACIIMNNMIVEDERDGDFDLVYDEMGEQVGGSHERTTNFNDFISQYEKIQDKEVHNQLREDLIEHLWNHHADRY
ncbi:uncharacterized protein [Oryza sativa Japonica Group]|uniref:uncharacterized protein n=1 Tax=Oryza sativa subsp. japonica TaxID=39947 RepID=UPI00339BECD9